MQVGRPTAKEKRHEGGGAGVPKPLHLVQGENDRLPRRLDPAHQRFDSAPRPVRRVLPLGRLEVHAGKGAGMGDVGVEHRRLVPLVQRNPSDGSSVPAEPAAALREQRRLAESPGGHQHGQPPARGHRPLDEFRAVGVPVDGVRDGDLLAQQPGRGLRPEGCAVHVLRRCGSLVCRMVAGHAAPLPRFPSCAEGAAAPRPAGCIPPDEANAVGLDAAGAAASDGNAKSGTNL